jgi:hypothetical protein
MCQTEAILDSDSPVPGIKPRCFNGKPRSSSGRRSFWPPTGGNERFPCPKITGNSRTTAVDRQKHWLEGWQGPGHIPGRSPFWRGNPRSGWGSRGSDTTDESCIGKNFRQPGTRKISGKFVMTEKHGERKMEQEEIIPGGTGIHATSPETHDGRVPQ